MKTITKEQILWLFHYDRPNGKLYWKNHWNKSTRTRLIGLEAGAKHVLGYKIVRIMNRDWQVHRLVYLIEKGVLPEYIDHINGNRIDNRFLNLRLVNKRQNAQNFTAHRNGKLVGTSFEKNRGLWESSIHIDGKKKHLGRFKTEFEAHQRYVQELKIRGLNELLRVS